MKHGSKIIYDMHEYELDRVPRASILKKILIYLLEELTIPFTDYIMTVSYSIKKYYKKRFNKKIFLILNSPQITNFDTQDRAPSVKKLNKFIVVGNVSYGRNVNELIKIFSKSNLDLTFMGDINEKFNEEQDFLININEFNNIHYKKAVKPDEISNVMEQFDASLFFYDVSYKNYDFALPNKFLLSVMKQMPIICFKSNELKLFEKRHKVKLNLINSLDELMNIKITKNFILKEKALKFYSKERQIKTLKKLVNNLILK